MRAGDYDPSTLGEIDAVDVVSIDLAGYRENAPRSEMSSFVIAAPRNPVQRPTPVSWRVSPRILGGMTFSACDPAQLPHG